GLHRTLRTHRRRFRAPAVHPLLRVCTSNSADLSGRPDRCRPLTGARDSGITKASVTTSGLPIFVGCGGADTALASLPTLSRRRPTTGAKAVDYFDASQWFRRGLQLTGPQAEAGEWHSGLSA